MRGNKIGVEEYLGQLGIPIGDRKFLTRELLFDLYVKQQYSTVEISKAYAVSRNTLNNLFNRYHTNARTPAEAGRMAVSKVDYRPGLFTELAQRDTKVWSFDV